jgi:hypothetical protein
MPWEIVPGILALSSPGLCAELFQDPGENMACPSNPYSQGLECFEGLS